MQKTTKHIIIKILRNTDKEKNLKTSQREMINYMWRKKDKNDFWTFFQQK